MRKKNLFVSPEAFFAIAIIGILLLLLLPIPPFLIDLSLCLSLIFSLMTLFLTLYVESPLEFSSFPSLLLFLTLFRLSLNISTTRSILSKAEAGQIIHTFGNFVVQGHLIIGVVVFSLLTVINFIVITKGAGRVAEVAARFTLESLPGKQLAIDAETQAGGMAPQEAKNARGKIEEEADFFGAMDGASKFVKGDAIAAIVIVLINLFGGLLVGATRGLSLMDSCETFILLTIGDGLITQIPALLISVAAGIMVTRVSAGRLASLLPRQLISSPLALFLTGVIVFALGLIPGMPWFLMLPCGGGLCFYSLHLNKKINAPSHDEKTQEKSCFPIEIQLGIQLTSLANPLVAALGAMREQFMEKWGVKIPSFHIRDRKDLPPKGFVVKLRDFEILSGRALDLKGLENSLHALFEQHLHEMINRAEVFKIIEKVKKEDPLLTEELFPERIKIGQLLRILQNLLKEKIPIKDSHLILSILVDHLPTKGEIDLIHLSEVIRQGLSRGISEHFFGEKKKAYAILLDPKVEQTLQVAYQKKDTGSHLVLRPATGLKILKALEELMEVGKKKGVQPVILTHPAVRRPFRDLLEKEWPHLPILSYAEIVKGIEIQAMGTISSEVLGGLEGNNN